ncbi:hypothetical protein ACGY1D_13590 [Burkholderia pseudomallei]
MAISRVATSDALAAAQADIAATRTDVAGVKTDVAGVKTDVAALGPALENLQTSLEASVGGISTNLDPSLSALQAAVIATVNAQGPQPGEARQFAVSRGIPAGWSQFAGPPMTLSNGTYALSLNGPGDPTASYSHARSVVCSDGLHVVSFAGNSINMHYLFDENTGTFDTQPLPTGLVFQGALNYPVACELGNGDLLAFGGASTTADGQVTAMYSATAKTWTQLANVPAGGFGGGVAFPMKDGRIVWIPAVKRNASSAVANSDTWLYYTAAPVNAWTTVVVANSIPSGVLTNNSYANNSVGTGVPLPSGKIAVMGQGTGNTDWYLADPAANTFTLLSDRPIATNTCLLFSTPYGFAYVASVANANQVAAWTESTGAWSVTNTFMGSKVTSGTAAKWRARKLKSGLYLGGASSAISTIIHLDDYNPSGVVWASKN